MTIALLYHMVNSQGGGARGIFIQDGSNKTFWGNIFVQICSLEKKLGIFNIQFWCFWNNLGKKSKKSWNLGKNW